MEAHSVINGRIHCEEFFSSGINMRSGFNIFISLLGLCDSLEFFQWKWEISRGGMGLFGGKGVFSGIRN